MSNEEAQKREAAPTGVDPSDPMFRAEWRLFNDPNMVRVHPFNLIFIVSWQKPSLVQGKEVLNISCPGVSLECVLLTHLPMLTDS